MQRHQGQDGRERRDRAPARQQHRGQPEQDRPGPPREPEPAAPGQNPAPPGDRAGGYGPPRGSLHQPDRDRRSSYDPMAAGTREASGPRDPRKDHESRGRQGHYEQVPYQQRDRSRDRQPAGSSTDRDRVPPRGQLDSRYPAQEGRYQYGEEPYYHGPDRGTSGSGGSRDYDTQQNPAAAAAATAGGQYYSLHGPGKWGAHYIPPQGYPMYGGRGGPSDRGGEYGQWGSSRSSSSMQGPIWQGGSGRGGFMGGRGQPGYGYGDQGRDRYMGGGEQPGYGYGGQGRDRYAGGGEQPGYGHGGQGRDRYAGGGEQPGYGHGGQGRDRYAGGGEQPGYGYGSGGQWAQGGGDRGPYSGGRQPPSGGAFPGSHSGGVSAHRHEPYSQQQSRSSGWNAGSALQETAVAQQAMTAVLEGKPHNFIEANPSGISQVLAVRPGHGTVAMKTLEVLVNLYRLKVGLQQLYQYDVSFQRARSKPESNAPDQADPGSSSSSPLQKPPANAREIINAFVQQYWDCNDACAFDGSKALVVARPPRLKRGVELPSEYNEKLVVAVTGVDVPEKGTKANWKLSIQLARVITQVQDFNSIPEQLLMLLAARQDLSPVQKLYNDAKQPLEWVLRQALIEAHRLEVMEVGRTLYFSRNLGNRNIGGALQAVQGLFTAVKPGEHEVYFAADQTMSPFLRTDKNLVECWADLVGFHLAPAAPGRGSGPGGGRGGGRGRGRSLPEVGEPDVRRLLEELQRDSRRRLIREMDRRVRNRKVLHRGPDGSTRKFTAVGLTPEPADQAMFWCQYKQPDSEGNTGQEMSVAHYFAKLKQPLAFPQLPAVVMKISKKGKGPQQIWIPLERLWFDKNQRERAVTHKGGTEQMIEGARKQPQELAAAIQQPITQTTSSSSSRDGRGGEGQKVLQGMQVELGSSMTHVNARVLPGPWLAYKEAHTGQVKAQNTAMQGQWNMNRNKFADPASLKHWGLLAVLPRREFDGHEREYASFSCWMYDCIKRFHDLGIDLGFGPGAFAEVAGRQLRDDLMSRMEWLEHEEGTPYHVLEEALRTARERAGGDRCQLIMCFIRHKPSDLYSQIKVASELTTASGGLGLVTQVVVASKTDFGSFCRGTNKANQRSQYQANLAMKVNAKVGGVNTCWAVAGEELLRGYFSREVPAIQVFGIDINHPSRVAGACSKAAVVGSTDPAFCRYAQSCWEEEMGGSEALSRERMTTAFKELIMRYYHANNGRRPGCLLVYRDGVSDSELERVRCDEVASIIQGCAELSEDYRPRIVYVVVQKRHHVRMFDASNVDARTQHGLKNLEPGTVIDHTIVSPSLYDFYLNSHKDIPNAGTNRAARYICLLDELGFGPDGLQVFTYWMCFLYCRCARSVSIVAPVYYAHLLAYRVRVLDGADDSISLASGSSAGSGREGRQAPRYCDSLAGKMFFV